MPESEFNAAAPITVNLLAVIVLYKIHPCASVSFSTLQTAANNASPGVRLKILLYDNTPGGQSVADLPAWIQYECALHNNGLPAAYNRALEIAEAEGFDWLLSLDQDTSLPEQFLSMLSEILSRLPSDSLVAAVVPQITDGGRMLSPSWWLWGSIPRVFSFGFTGIAKRPTSAFNSASTLRVSSLRLIGGYDLRFWLDYSDAYLYRQLDRYGMQTYVAGNIQVDHQFSVLDMNRRVSLARYQNILDAGCAFWDSELGWLAGLDYTARLAYRTFYKHWKHGHDPAFRHASWEMLKKRLLWSKNRRIENWKRDIDCRLFPSPNSQDATKYDMRSRISVCMATFNGERYVAAQLQSILAQLSPDSEVIVVDDASCDETVAVIQRFRDERIRILRNPRNRGVVASFERALMEATGDIIFLSDQDDIWRPEKVSHIMRAFGDPMITLVQSDAAVIDAEGNVMAQSYLQTRGGFVASVMQNILRCRYLGCAMAFRRQMLGRCIPFPKNIPMHDVWIGIVNACFGETAYIDEPLVEYRRYGQNVSRKGNPMQRIRRRLNLLFNTMKVLLRAA